MDSSLRVNDPPRLEEFLDWSFAFTWGVLNLLVNTVVSVGLFLLLNEVERSPNTRFTLISVVWIIFCGSPCSRTATLAWDYSLRSFYIFWWGLYLGGGSWSQGISRLIASPISHVSLEPWTNIGRGNNSHWLLAPWIYLPWIQSMDSLLTQRK